MNQLLSEQVIGGLLQKARGSASAVKAGQQAQKAATIDLRQPRQLSSSLTKSLSVLQEAYARRIESGLSTLLRVTFETKVATVEQLSYSEFLSRIPNPNYLASFRIPSIDTIGLMQIELPLVFQILDLTLGGFGASDAGVRDLTEIEEELFRPAAQMLCHELRAAWRPVLDLDCQFDKRHGDAPSANAMPLSEKILLMNFEITLGESKAKMALAFSSAVSTVLFRELSAQESFVEPVTSQKNRARIQELLLDSQFDAELVLPPGKISMGEVFRLQPGGTVVLQASTSEPIHLNIAGKNMFLATPVRCGVRRAAEIFKVLSITSEKEGK